MGPEDSVQIMGKILAGECAQARATREPPSVAADRTLAGTSASAVPRPAADARAPPRPVVVQRLRAASHRTCGRLTRGPPSSSGTRPIERARPGDAAAKHYDERQLAALVLGIAAANLFNRV